MYYGLNDNVYLVEGHERSCIYDFNTLNLYSLNKTFTEKMSLINKGQLTDTLEDKELIDVLNSFIEKKLIILSDKPIYHDITEIKAQDLKCKFAWIEITNRCNLKCKHCYNESNIESLSKMSFSDWKLAINSLQILGIKRIQIIGGEPFIDGGLLRSMLDYAIGKFDFIEIFTNGTLISNQWFEYFRDNKIHIALSVYSYIAKMHDNVTGVQGSFIRTNNCIQKLKEYGVHYRVCNVLMKGNKLGEKNTDLYTLSEKKDVVRLSGRASLRLLNEELIKKRLITKKTFQQPLNLEFCKKNILGHNCFMENIYIAANLDVYPCVMERRLKHCNIKQEKQIVLNEKIRKFTKDQIEGCKNCEYRYACFDCRPDSISGNILDKPWYCTYDPIHGSWYDIDKFIEKMEIQSY